ncbi:MAG: formylglycine-generating enzyme family protein [Candidatus Electryoneaceae bacterium]|nr:formylglycine-generating enzyme family protein [Candidatus Electryoneaceae bacterium]
MSIRFIISGLLVLLLSVSSAPAQVMHIHTADGTESFNLAEVDSITFSEAMEREFHLTDDVTITMIWIPPGEFMMGAQEDEQDADDFEYPRHRVTLDYGFWMGKYEVTQAQWEAVMGNNPSNFEGANRPVECVSWNDIQSFESELDGEFRLPSEAEWEYACRADTDTRFYWGDDPNYNVIDEYAIYNGNDPNETAVVGTKLPNDWRLYDMSGNVWEWCEDTWHENYQSAPDDGSAWIQGGNQNIRACRGGAWDGLARSCRSARRTGSNPNHNDYSDGFRLVRDAD